PWPAMHDPVDAVRFLSSDLACFPENGLRRSDGISGFMNQRAFAGGFARPMKMTIPSPPGLPVMGGMSKSIRGFQLLTAHTLPAWSMTTLVIRIKGLKLGGPCGP